MPRTARVFIENACYHIISRGVQRDPVFKGADDFDCFAHLVHKYKIKCGCLVYGYCFMTNHVHFVLESPLGARAMSSFMHRLNQTHAMSFNSKYNRTGHLWQNRYKSFVVTKDVYLMNLISYVEFNPVRAGAVTRPEDYPYSSYKARVLGEGNIILDQLK